MHKTSNTQATELLQLIFENQGIIHRICNLYCNTIEDKEDLKQEIILQIWKSYKSFRADSKFSTWLYRIAFNTAITNLRKSKRHPIVESLGFKSIEEYDNEDVLDTRDDIDNLHIAIRKLNEIERALMMLYLEEKKYKEIAQILGISEKNVSVKIVRAKEKLKLILKAVTSHV